MLPEYEFMAQRNWSWWSVFGSDNQWFATSASLKTFGFKAGAIQLGSIIDFISFLVGKRQATPDFSENSLANATASSQESLRVSPLHT